MQNFDTEPFKKTSNNYHLLNDCQTFIPRLIQVSLQDLSPFLHKNSSSKHDVSQELSFSFEVHRRATVLHSSQKPNTS